MSQNDERELSEIGRSIDSLFAQAEAGEGFATDPHGSAAEPESDGASAPEPDPLAESESAAVEPIPGEMEPIPGEMEPIPGEMEPIPGEMEPIPGEMEPIPGEMEPIPGEMEPIPGEMEPIPGEVAQAPNETDQALSAAKQALREATLDYLQGEPGERTEVGNALLSAAEAAHAADALDEICSSVDTLLLQAVWDRDVENLVAELIEGDVSVRMVARLGRVQVEEERGRLIQAYVMLGDPVAEAIATALTVTEDRLARKTYVAALGAFGEAGARAVEKMLQDSRWFVVRNGVAVLGVVGTPEVIEHLTASLANEHAGVRRETVRSLAKIGGENAGLLVSSMLGDSDPEVRAEAARAVSALKAERAYKQLVEILRRGDEDEVIEQVLRALGGLGDPAAVSAIEKRVKGSMFSTPSTGVRIAGLSALASIGTPKALGLVKKARGDKDEEVSSAAKQLLAGR